MPGCERRASPSKWARAPTRRPRSTRFLLRVREGRPLFHLKLATSLDGRIATASGESQWITGEAARADGQRLRATHDAILVGSGTVAGRRSRADLPAAGPRAATRRCASSSIRRRVCAGRRSLPRRRDRTPVWLLCTAAGAGSAARGLAGDGRRDDRGRGRRRRPGRCRRGGARRSATRRLTRVLVEGGGRGGGGVPEGRTWSIASACYRAGLRAGRRRPLCGRAIWRLQRLDFAPRFRLVSAAIAGRRHAGNAGQERT